MNEHGRVPMKLDLQKHSRPDWPKGHTLPIPSPASMILPVFFPSLEDPLSCLPA